MEDMSGISKGAIYMIGVFMILLVSVFTMELIYSSAEENEEYGNCITPAEAVVLNIDTEVIGTKHRTRTNKVLTYEYTVDYVTYRNTGKVNMSNPVLEGDVISVYYDRDKPEIVRLSSEGE